MSQYQLLQGDCREVLKTLPDNSVDAIVTDPPYGLEFMGKEWDAPWKSQDVRQPDDPSFIKTDNAYGRSKVRYAMGSSYGGGNEAMVGFQGWYHSVAVEMYRVLKPGGHILSFGGSRTYHRMACAVEDAGFEVRDQLMWVYGSGFPKSHNISKAMDKNGGKDLTWFIDYVIKTAEEKGISKSELSGLFPSKNGNPTGWLWNKQNGQGITLEQYNKIKDFLGLPFESIKEVERAVIGVGKAGLTKGSIANFAGKTEFEITAPATDEAKQWEGWGTALKPAHEPIVLARKPLDGTVVDNVRKWGVGGLNIDGCRVSAEGEDFSDVQDRKDLTGKLTHHHEGGNAEALNKLKTLGRFPANLIHDGSQDVLDLFPESNGGAAPQKSNIETGRHYDGGWGPVQNEERREFGSGSAARFFYCPKANKRDRDEGNNHPTVKPTDLMRYLCRLVTPPGGTVLDPFNGSGSTGKAAVLEGFNYVGIEMNPEYIQIAEARIKAAYEKGAGQ